MTGLDGKAWYFFNFSNRAKDDQVRSFLTPNRRHGYVISETKDAGRAAFYTGDLYIEADLSPRLKTKHVTAVLLRKHGTEKKTKLIGFLYSAPSTIVDTIET